MWSSRASCSAGIELRNHEIVVLGMSRSWSGSLAIGHAVMADGIDTEPVRAALQGLGILANGQLSARERSRVVAVLAKAEASHDGLLRGHRHTMLDDSDISHARAFVCGALASVFGHAEIYVSGGAEHQGPDGGGPVALLQELWLTRKPTVILVTHDLRESAFLANRIVVMSARPGRVIEDETVPFERPRTIAMTYDAAFVALNQRLRSLIVEVRAGNEVALGAAA